MPSTKAAARARAPWQPGEEEVEAEARRYGIRGADGRPRRRRVLGDQRGGERDVLGVALARLVLDELLLLVEEAAADGAEEAAAVESDGAVFQVVGRRRGGRRGRLAAARHFKHTP